MKHYLLFATLFLSSLANFGEAQENPTLSQIEARTREAEAAGPIRVLSNRGKRPVRLTLSDRSSTILLPPGWRVASRGFYSKNADGTPSGIFSHFFRPITKSSGGLRVTILETGSELGAGRDWRGARNLMVEMANGQWDRFLWKVYRESGGQHPTTAKKEIADTLRRTRQQEITLGGLSGYMTTPTDGLPLKASRDGLLGALPAPRRFIAVFGDTKSWTFADSSRQTATIQAMLQSFVPG
jgi:hypothetical protein